MTLRSFAARFTAVAALSAAAVAGMPADGISSPSKSTDSGGKAHLHGPGRTHADQHHSDGAGHETSEGLSLVSAGGDESVEKGSGCRQNVRVRSYRVAAINVDITLNRYLDHDPNGRMYVLEQDVSNVRREEEANRRARQGGTEPAVTSGLQGDAIQPLTLRVNQDECLRIRLRNALADGEAASLHLHDSELRVAGGGPAIATNPQASVVPGKSVIYEWMVGPGEQEGTRYFHSHGEFRQQTSHGLFGAVIVEPKGSVHLSPSTGRPQSTGWEAMIRTSEGSDFREFALFYHEIGHENYRFLDGKDQSLPLVDSLTGAYRPGARAINYRSEPFSNRLKLQMTATGRFDESVAYSSYVFGDPATPVGRSYLGDPVKQRVIHAGSEVAHVHHVHGGSIRWPRQPKAEPSRFDLGIQKRPALTPKVSERIDSQTISPSETFDVENECGSGGCQGSAGDFLFHCHVAHHYFAGMWGLWRVYNTLQPPQVLPEEGLAGDSMGALAELPDRRGGMKPAVTSAGLVGKTVNFGGSKIKIETGNLNTVVEQQLPPQGLPKGYDASVLDWAKEGDLYLGEPETEAVWPGFRSPLPGKRPAFRFDPATGKLAYPFLRPHLGKRPPFPPGHNPAPFLDPVTSGPGPPEPGANGPESVCPEWTRVKQFQVQAISTPLRLNQKSNITDPDGELYVLKEQEQAVRADPAKRIPLAIRANAREDCVDVVLRSELPDSKLNHGFSKVNMHIHFMQFDVQASDGVIAGFNYEQSVRPFSVEGETVVRSSAPGARSLALWDADRFQRGVTVGIGMDQYETFEVRRIESVSGATVTFDQPLDHAHSAGEYVSTEFVQARWYPDVQFGTAYFHDHVNAIASWKHGLFGALVAEPPGSSYHDPHSGEPLRSGPLADIHSRVPLSQDIDGSFREMVLFIQDDNPLTHIGRSTGGTFNLRAEPLAKRKGKPPDLFNSKVHGDPETPILEAYAGDPLVIRSLVAGTNEVHTFHVDGHWFRTEPYSKTSPWAGTVHLGISERYDLMIPSAGGPLRKSGDYLYRSGRPLKVSEGNWGLIRVYEPGESGSLRHLPGRRPQSAGSKTADVCPGRAPGKDFRIEAVEAEIAGLSRDGKMFVLASGGKEKNGASRAPHPLVLRANSGDCIRMNVTNRTSADLAFHADMLVYDPKEAAAGVGRNPGRPLRPGQTGNYRFFAHPEIGETVALLRDSGDPVGNPRKGLYGAIIVGPAGAKYRDPFSGSEGSVQAGWNVEVVPESGPAYRDFTLFMHDEDASIGSHKMPYIQRPAGKSAISYGARDRAGDRKRENQFTLAQSDSNSEAARSAALGRSTPLLEAVAGEPVKLHVVSAFSEQAQAFFVEGHRWKIEPHLDGSDEISSLTLGGLQTVTIEFMGGAGGISAAPGYYLYGNHRGPYTEAGMWGILRVHPVDSTGRLKALPVLCEGSRPRPDSCGPDAGALAAGAFALLASAGAAGWLYRRTKRPSGFTTAES